jgi:hypothetical protein
MFGLGGGAIVLGGNGVVHLTANTPAGVTQAHYAAAHAHPGFRDGVYVEATAWRLLVYAVCAYGVTGRQTAVSSNLLPAGAWAGGVSVACPAGKQVISMGGAVGSQFILSSVDVDAALTTVTMTWGRPLDTPGSATSFQDVWAVCVDPVSGLQRVRTVSASNSNDKSLTATCPSGMELFDLAGGLETEPRRNVGLNNLLPGTFSGIAYTGEMVYGYTGNWTAFATAICGP